MQVNVYHSWKAAGAWNMSGVLILHFVLIHTKEVCSVDTEEGGEGVEARQTLW